MNTKTDSPASTESPSPPNQHKPRFALFVATACGLGYLPIAPGTWGSLGGLLLSYVLLRLWPHTTLWESGAASYTQGVPFILPAAFLATLVAAIGVWSAGRAERFWSSKDPQQVVIDEVSGQLITLLFVLPTVRYFDGMTNFSYGFWWRGLPNWKYLLLGFILFRAFDIWKPFPARQAESLPGGWGIMADDWIAGMYAALGLWIARMLGL